MTQNKVTLAVAPTKYAKEKKKRKIFGGGETQSGLFGLGSSDASIKKAKEDDRKKKEANTRMRIIRDNNNPNAPMSDLIKKRVKK
jgi:hypothetical protein